MKRWLLLALALPWEGTEAHAGVMASSSHLSPLIAVTRDGGEGRTSLTKAGRVRLDLHRDAVARERDEQVVERVLVHRGALAGREHQLPDPNPIVLPHETSSHISQHSIFGCHRSP